MTKAIVSNPAADSAPGPTPGPTPGSAPAAPSLDDPRVVVTIEAAGSLDAAVRMAPEVFGLAEGRAIEPLPASFDTLRRQLPAHLGGRDASARGQVLWEEAVEEARKRLLFQHHDPHEPQRTPAQPHPRYPQRNAS